MTSFVQNSNFFLLIPGLILIFLFMGCDQEHTFDAEESMENPDSEEQVEVLQTGIASWYGPGFHGRRTSNMDRFDQNKLTAAHRTLPFNTIVEVVNTENNESVEVRINDRGPYARNRIIDLSRAAAEEINMVDQGLTEVELVLVEAGGRFPDDLNRPTFTIQLGEYNRVNYAERFTDLIGEGVRIEQRFPRGSNRPVYMIYYGNYNSFSGASEELARLEERGFEGLVRQID